MNRSFLHKLLLARRLYELAREQLSSTSGLSLSIGVNLLQDAVEVFLLAVSEHINAEVTTKTTFDKYFDLINAKITPNELPFRPRLVALNKLRVNSKHYGLSPAQGEVEGLLVVVREFFDEVSNSVLGLPFATVTLIDLLRDGEAKELLREAEKSYVIQDFENCIINCRKAIFVRIERDYDVSNFAADKAPGVLSGLALGYRAPFWARNKQVFIHGVAPSLPNWLILRYIFGLT
ncbi:MAG: hypothetical protein HY788_23175 [Deltaproteobacteria bacterium]|nr:hypothetical protein [Deltaproteobacteria bacterium]